MLEVKICKLSGYLFCFFGTGIVCVIEPNYQIASDWITRPVGDSPRQSLWRPLMLISCFLSFLLLPFSWLFLCSLTFLCLHCQVKKHVRSFHSEKIYQCTECDKAFCRPDKLRLHMLRHSDRKDFLCSTCGKQFKVCKQWTAWGCLNGHWNHVKLRINTCLLVSSAYLLLTKNWTGDTFVPYVWVSYMIKSREKVTLFSQNN